MHSIHNFIAQNPYLALLLWTIFLGAFSAYVGSLRTPTKDSGQGYISYFAVMQSLVLNFQRIKPQLESSPNWDDAIKKYLAQQPAPAPEAPKQ
jgi:hypothetical protein